MSSHLNPVPYIIKLSKYAKANPHSTYQGNLISDIHTIVDNSAYPSFNAQSISMVFYAMAKLYVAKKINKSDVPLKKLFELCLTHAPRFNAQEIANTLWALAKLGVRWGDLEASLQQKLMKACKDNAPHFNAQGIANTLWALANLGVQWSALKADLQQKLKEVCKDNARRFNSQGIANTLWALAKLGVQWNDLEADLQKELKEACKDNARDFDSQEIANTLWALAKLGVQWNDLTGIRTILKEACKDNARSFNFQGIANTLWALANLGVQWGALEADVQKELIKACKRNAPRFNSQDIANTLWALAKLGVQWRDLEGIRTALKEACKDNAPYFNAQEIANTLWALANFGVQWGDLEADLQGELIKACKDNAPRFNSQGTTNTLWALANLEVRWGDLEADLQQKLMKVCKDNAPYFNAQEIANTLWALAKLGVRWDDLKADLQQKLMKACKDNAPYFNAQDIANTLWALANFGVQWGDLEADLQKELIKACKRNAQTFKPQEIANTLWAFAKLGVQWGDLEADLQQKLMKACKRHMRNFNSRDVGNTLWAFVHLGCGKEFLKNEALESFMVTQICHYMGKDTLEYYRQIATACYWFDIALPIDVQKHLDTEVSKRPKSESSQLHRRVSQCIRANFPPVNIEDEARIKGIFDIDILVEAPKGSTAKGWVIEVDGPVHDTPAHQVLDRVKEKMLRELGYRVIRISYKQDQEKMIIELSREYSSSTIEEGIQNSGLVSLSSGYPRLTQLSSPPLMNAITPTSESDSSVTTLSGPPPMISLHSPQIEPSPSFGISGLDLPSTTVDSKQENYSQGNTVVKQTGRHKRKDISNDSCARPSTSSLNTDVVNSEQNRGKQGEAVKPKKSRFTYANDNLGSGASNTIDPNGGGLLMNNPSITPAYTELHSTMSSSAFLPSAPMISLRSPQIEPPFSSGISGVKSSFNQ